MLQAKCFGLLDVRFNDQPVVISSRPAQTIFTYLLLHPDTPIRREWLAGEFWPEATEANARSNLRHALWRIRKALGEAASERIFTDDLIVSYHPQPGDELDVTSFEAVSPDESNIDALLQAVALFKGDLLPGFYEEWAMRERERLHMAFERKIVRLLDALLACGRHDEALTWGERWMAMGGIPEPAYRACMLAYANLGNQASAVAQYQRCADLLMRDLGVEPSELTQQVYAQIRAGSQPQPIQRVKPPIFRPTLPAFMNQPQKPAPIFVGREAELAALDRFLVQSLSGQLQVVFVRGEAGSGKTALLRQFIRNAYRAYPDLVVGWGVCNSFFGQGAPFLPFRDVLHMLVGDFESLYAHDIISHDHAVNLFNAFPLVVHSLVEEAPALINSFLSSPTLTRQVASIFPGEKQWRERMSANCLQDIPLPAEQDRPQIFEQFTQLLHTLSSHHPLVFILDDLQWMDPGTGRLLFHLIRSLPTSRILFACAYRLEEVAAGRQGERHPLESLINELQASYGEIAIDLDKARETSGRSFIDAYLDSEPNLLDSSFRDELFHRTRGHPLFTIEMLRDLQERGEVNHNANGCWVASKQINWESLSRQVEGIIAERIGRLDSSLQDLLLAASVEGEQFTLQVLARLTGVDERHLLNQLSRELVKRHRLVQELGAVAIGDQCLVRFRFIHALVQQYLYLQLGAAERASFHKIVAESLEALYRDEINSIAVPLASHYRKAGVKEKAVEYLLQAGDQARNWYATQEAIDHYQNALVYLREMSSSEQTARTMMKLYLVYHSAFDFARAQGLLQEYHARWGRLNRAPSRPQLPPSPHSYRLSTIKSPCLDPGYVETFFDIEWMKELFCGLVEWTEDRNVIPMVARHWDVLDCGRRYLFHLRTDVYWSDGEPVTAPDFEFAWKRVLNPETRSLPANLLYDIVGARDYHQGCVSSPDEVKVTATGPYSLQVDLEGPCGYFPYILGDPISFAIPRHVVEREGKAWSEPGRIVTNGAFSLASWDQVDGKVIQFVRNPRYFGGFKGNVEKVNLAFHENELDVSQAFLSGELDRVQFLIPPLPPEVLQHYRQVGQLQVSTIPFVDAVYFITDRPPFDDPRVRCAFALATDREQLACVIENLFPARGGYIPPSLPGHSPDLNLPYDPHRARRLLAEAGYPQARDLPPIGLLLNLVGLEKGDNLVYTALRDMWHANLGITLEKRLSQMESLDFNSALDFHMFFTGWLADYPDPASFLQTNYLIEQTHWQNPRFSTLVEAGRHSLDQNHRIDLYRQADSILIDETVLLPLFYGHIYELRQPWVQKLTGASIYSPQWKDIILLPH